MNEAVVDAVRRIVMRWAITRTELTANASAGDTSITVKSTRRFKVGDQILVHNADEDMENDHWIAAIPNRNTITLTKPLKWAWTAASGTLVVKTQDDQFVKAVFFGEPDVITDLPAVTVAGVSRNSEWMAFRATKERHNLEIGVYVSADTQEGGDRFLQRIVDDIQYGLKRNLYPLLNDYLTVKVTVPIAFGDFHIKVDDSTPLTAGQQIIIEDEYNIQVVGIDAICDATTIQIAQPAEYDFDITTVDGDGVLTDGAIIIRPNRLPFNSWPTDINFGKIKKGTLLKAAVISYFIEEMEDQKDAGYGDTQIR